MTTTHPIKAGLISARRTVPRVITRPEYALTGEPKRPRKPRLIKTLDEIDRMRLAGQAAYRVLEGLRDHVVAGVSTDHLDALAHDAYIAEGGYPSTLNYHGYPKAITPRRRLAERLDVTGLSPSSLTAFSQID